jgi:hypothetical protein
MDEIAALPISPEQKYCADCGKVIFRRAEICPNCGCRQIAARTSLFPTPAFSSPSAPSAPSTSPDPGKIILLFICNFLWNGFGNLLVGDKRGWLMALVNVFIFALGFFTGFLPSLLFCVLCCYLGYRYLADQMTDMGSTGTAGNGSLNL